jgi:MFS family permease
MEGVTHGLYLLWWVQEKQLPPAVVAAILAAGDVALLLLEVPTGWVADKFGHRASLLLGSIVQVAAMVCCWLGSGVPELVVASLLVAVGDAFRSGADEALLFRSCAALGKEDRFLTIAARAHTLQVFALVGLVAGGGVVATTLGFHAAWAVEIALCAAGVACAWAMSEPPAARSANEALNEADQAAPVAWRRFVGVIIPVAFLGGAASAGSFLAQTSGTSTAAELTVLVALITVAEAAGAALAPRVPAASARGQLMLGLGGVLLIAAALSAPVTFYAVVVGLAFLEGVGNPLRGAAIQRAAPDGMRARAASAANACDMIFSTIALPLAGVWIS